MKDHSTPRELQNVAVCYIKDECNDPPSWLENVECPRKHLNGANLEKTHFSQVK